MITKLLVANRGEIARRVIRSAHAMGIQCVAVYSDADSSAPHVREADQAVRLPGYGATDTYLRSDLLVRAALMTGADAIHPGYGFLSEDAQFARECTRSGLAFVGPPADVIEAMGSKLNAKAAMAAAGVPVLGTVELPAPSLGAGAGVAEVPRGLMDEVAALGWPVLVKASAGGGGRGMRVVERAADLAAALEGASREASSAFGDGTVFIEPYVLDPRHIEVQIVGDTHGNVVHLFERECSIQRRHQKIVEECPAAGLDSDTRDRLTEAAITVARTIGYIGAGTVEFLLAPDGRIAFLEVNTRLQVEHPVTEAVTGIDLVRLQLLVAEGAPLPPEVMHPTVAGHAIEVRLYAEDPTRSWQPSAGHLDRFMLQGSQFATPTPGMPGVRVDAGFAEGTDVSPYYDPMLAKVISHAPSRGEAARLLAQALRRSRIHGVSTNRDLLVRILEHPEFLDGRIDTGFLVRHDPAALGAPLASEEAELLHAQAAALALQASHRASAPVLRPMPSGWRNNPNGPAKVSFEGHHGAIEVEYGFDRSGRSNHLRAVLSAPHSRSATHTPASPESLGAAGVGEGGVGEGGATVLECTPDEVAMEIGGVRTRFEVQQVDGVAYVDSPLGSSVLRVIERFRLPESQGAAGSLAAPLPGTVVKVAVDPGQAVEAGDLLVVIEAMKMEHEVSAPRSGIVSAVRVEQGHQVEPGEVLVVIDAEEGS